jgi:hypothetical protein
MARKSKVKARPGKQKKKKPGKKMLTAGIGIISTVDMPTGWRNAFKTGLNQSGVRIKFKHKESYKENKLKTAIDKFNNDQEIGLIVTVGGLVIFKVADTNASKPFISLIGGPPANHGAKFYGGVSLQSYQSNPARINYLGTKGFGSANVGLYYNPNSAMSGVETQLWTGAQPPIAATGDNSKNAFGGDFANMPGTITAVVVSADPFFQEAKNDLVAAANNSGKYLCYPLQDFGSSAPKPDHGEATLYGPALTDAYKLMGERAAVVLTTSAPLSPLLVSVPDTIKDV